MEQNVENTTLGDNVAKYRNPVLAKFGKTLLLWLQYVDKITFWVM
jgi:hypothetical protein